MKSKKVWIRFAGERRAWEGKNTTPYRWRIFVHPNFERGIKVKRLRLEGKASNRNNRTGWRQKKDENGVIAWIDYFGDLTVRDGVATIVFQEP